MGQSNSVSSFSGTAGRTIINLVKYTDAQDHEDFQLKCFNTMWSSFCIFFYDMVCNAYANACAFCGKLCLYGACLSLSFGAFREIVKGSNNMTGSCSSAGSYLIMIINCSTLVYWVQASQILIEYWTFPLSYDLRSLLDNHLIFQMEIYMLGIISRPRSSTCLNFQ